MPDRDDIRWFKQQFHGRIEPALAGTPFGADLVVAIACQETGSIWARLRRQGLPEAQILKLCVGDTLDADRGRRAFPRTKADLLAHHDGDAAFAVARQALVDMAQHVPGFAAVARRPHKFCHGFGLFQYDLQFFRVDPDYFLERRYEQFEHTLGKCLESLDAAARTLGWQRRDTLSEMESAAVAIAYNSGRYRPRKGLKQGHFDGTRYYGEALFDYLRLSRSVAPPGGSAPLPAPGPGEAILPPASPVTATGPFLRVATRTSTLRLRREPRISRPVWANVVADLPDGHPVRAISGTPVGEFMELETNLAGALLRGFSATRYLEADPSRREIPLPAPSSTPPRTGVVAAAMPRRAGSVTRRRDPANAHSLNEPGQPRRPLDGGTNDAPGLREALGAIVDWLAVDDPAHRRYRPGGGLTYCNLYAHDVCHLAGVYLPRVWWSTPAVLALSRGETVAPLYGHTLREMRANDLFRWLRDFGEGFGWRQTGTLDKLQIAANQGAVALIIARRREDGRSGHVSIVVPEAAGHAARRDDTGAVTMPLQSQAGSRNHRRWTARSAWWHGAQFAEHAFWIHA